jgi:phosphoribosyl-AMP cyclohydrolase
MIPADYVLSGKAQLEKQRIFLITNPHGGALVRQEKGALHVIFQSNEAVANSIGTMILLYYLRARRRLR